MKTVTMLTRKPETSCGTIDRWFFGPNKKSRDSLLGQQNSLVTLDGGAYVLRWMGFQEVCELTGEDAGDAAIHMLKAGLHAE
jgi:hypothetical protein